MGTPIKKALLFWVAALLVGGAAFGHYGSQAARPTPPGELPLVLQTAAAADAEARPTVLLGYDEQGILDFIAVQDEHSPLIHVFEPLACEASAESFNADEKAGGWSQNRVRWNFGPIPQDAMGTGIVGAREIQLWGHSRYYDPELGRFTQTDPMGYADSMNLYQAFNQSPQNFGDPYGLVDETGIALKAREVANLEAAGLDDMAYFTAYENTKYKSDLRNACDASSNCNWEDHGTWYTCRCGSERVLEVNDVAKYDERMTWDKDNWIKLLRLAERSASMGTVPSGDFIEKHPGFMSQYYGALETAGHPNIESTGGEIELIIALPFAGFLKGTPGVAATYGGRLGNLTTREQISFIADELEARGWKVTGGGGRFPEEYLPGPGGARKGSNWLDITAIKDWKTLRINTVDTYANRVTPTLREANAAIKIRIKTPGDHLLLIPKKK